MKLIILHYHLRPGGIRRIIELASPHLLRANAALQKIVLATGENAASHWQQAIKENITPASLEIFVEPAFNYLSEQNLSNTEVTAQIRSSLKKLLADANQTNALVWAHNLGIARNLILTREIARACAAKKIPLVSHHHDWWFDNRWLRWPEMRRFGFRTLATAAKTIFPALPKVRHFTINQSDALHLQKHLGNDVGWLPNLSERAAPVSDEKLDTAKTWLRHQLNDRKAPVWILPCRLLRRKNVAEALLLARWLRPEAWLVTTGGASSADEQYYATVLSAAAHQHHWRLRLGILAGNETRKPTVAELLAASEAVMLTSIQEGFGLPYLEAAASRRPLIARAIPNIAPDLKQFGFKFPQCYDEIFVSPDLFNWSEEWKRQTKLFENWREQLPRACQNFVGKPALLAAQSSPCAVPFSRLTLSAQIEVLTKPVKESWKKCASLNPFLSTWKQRAAQSKLKITPWPRSADDWLSGAAYAKRFYELAERPQKPPTIQMAVAAQNDFIRAKLDAEHLFPLLWSKES